MTSADSLTARVAQSAAWMVMMRWSIRALGFVNTIVVARILMPEDYGIVAIGMLVYGSIEIFGQFGFNLYLLKQTTINDSELNTIWTLSIARGFVCTVVMIAGAIPASFFFKDERVALLVFALSAIPALDGLQNIGMIKFQRELRFSATFIFDVSRKCLLVVCSILLALWLKNYWALVLSMLAERTFALVLSFVLSSYRPKLEVASWRKVFHFSKWIFSNNIVIFLRNNMDNVIVAKIAGPQFLGIYSIARELAELGTTEVVSPAARALLPGFARIANDVPSLSAAYLRALSLMMAVGLPIGVGLGLVAEPFVLVALGEKWLAVIPMLQLLSIYGALRIGYAASGAIFLVRNHPEYDAYLAALTFGVGVPGILFCMSIWGANGVAYAMIVLTFAGVICQYALSTRLLSLPFTAAGPWIWRSIISTVVMAALVKSVDVYLHVSLEDAPLLRLIALASVGCVVYVTLHLGLWKLNGMPATAEAEALSLAKSLLGR